MKTEKASISREEILEILHNYWHYDAFRPLQEEIIGSVLEGRDTLALLPTGGGKSLCFQVPAMSRPGLCLVISPLIALMKDQVQHLAEKGIPAITVYSGMSRREIDVALDNCVYGKPKFLYLSPERLNNSVFLERVGKMPVNLLAVDEAHCIAQWGHDFRPSYLRIAEVRKFFPGVPVLALTATATPVVCDEILERLAFREARIFRKSFRRENIHFIVRENEHKEQKLLEILRRVPGATMIYARNRKRTRDIASFLQRNGIRAEYYHAGLAYEARNAIQEAWIQNKLRVIVCTNAFGMGIDKADVRTVIHWDIPESPEAYYQEAGRAGRDGGRAFAGLLYEAGDLRACRELMELQSAPVDVIRKTYHALGNYFQLATGAGAGESFDFDIMDFCRRFQINPLTARNALKILEENGSLSLSDSLQTYSRVHITADKETLYRFQVENSRWEPLIKMLLRIAPGVFDAYVNARERELAYHLSIPVQQVEKDLMTLQSRDILVYEPVKNLPQLTFLHARLEASDLQLDLARIRTIREAKNTRMESMLAYATNKTECRVSQLLRYFGEETARCGQCDICLERNKLGLSDSEFDTIYAWLRDTLGKGPVMPEELFGTGAPMKKEKMAEALRFMTDNRIIQHTPDNLLVWKG